MGKKRSKGPVASEPSNVDVGDRRTQFPDEPFSASGNKLFCNACREPRRVLLSPTSSQLSILLD